MYLCHLFISRALPRYETEGFVLRIVNKPTTRTHAEACTLANKTNSRIKYAVRDRKSIRFVICSRDSRATAKTDQSDQIPSATKGLGPLGPCHDFDSPRAERAVLTTGMHIWGPFFFDQIYFATRALFVNLTLLIGIMASTIAFTQPMNCQEQSRLLRLPGEIRNSIYYHCLTTRDPIIDTAPTGHAYFDRNVPILATALLRTCQLIYNEADRRLLYAHNTFRFSSVFRVRSFLQALRPECASMVQDIEIDARKVHSDHPGIAREWINYLAWGEGAWAKILGSLRMDARGLKVLRLNFESWPAMYMLRAELWNLLRALLLNVTGLERMVVIGASKGPPAASVEPWSPIHFVGGDDVGSDDLVQLMGRTLGQSEDKSKIIRWTRADGKIFLEVVTITYLKNHLGPVWRERTETPKATNSWPENGSCTWIEYQHRNVDLALETVRQTINPISAV